MGSSIKRTGSLAPAFDLAHLDVRDCAVLLMDFASGGRRRSVIAALRVEQLVEQEPEPARSQGT
ncbi:hypothetical protein EOA31_36305 [Mesorhizobium sp. M4B.F.Ca.ET.049.02.1.2]|nr:hypothetical protein EOA31_36305 [Mesorhizobium sp. M4B.F.Ca.ET.049.02.1.2]